MDFVSSRGTHAEGDGLGKTHVITRITAQLVASLPPLSYRGSSFVHLDGTNTKIPDRPSVTNRSV
ncbi:hypothetical protein THARTR1_06844 [Trichoderma harzianum]|uniref:Uncharacterized protein n=1 Tax=Trichoderma harzianum TaxID=5544 RepID=A0A2K0U4H6_TRIHA|nr:hypothetical protein THARTR1_06844 [Trichoderma harzianum]